jgi:hypothetical protein
MENMPDNNHVIAAKERGTARLSSSFNLVVDASATVAIKEPMTVIAKK